MKSMLYVLISLMFIHVLCYRNNKHRFKYDSTRVTTFLLEAKNKNKKVIDVDLSFLDNTEEEDEKNVEKYSKEKGDESILISSQISPISSEYIDVNKVTKALKRLDVSLIELDEIRNDCIPLASEALRTYTMQKSKNIYSAASFFAVSKVFGEMIDLKIDGFGGYRQAERKRIYFSKRVENFNDIEDNHDNDEAQYMNLKLNHQEDFILCSLSGNFIFERYDHDDFVAKILDICDIQSYELGDVIVTGEQGCQFFILPDKKDKVLENLNGEVFFDSVPVQCEIVDIDKLKVKDMRKKEMTTVEASLRVDSLASFGYGLSRSKIVKLIDRGEVLIDYKPITSPAQLVQIGQTITIRGKGNLLLKDSTTTNRGRFRVRMQKIQ